MGSAPALGEYETMRHETGMRYAACRRRASHRGAGALATLLLLASAGVAGSPLHIELDGQGTAAAAGSELRFFLRNRADAALTELRWHASAAAQLQCEGQTVAGRGFAAGGRLESLDAVACRATSGPAAVLRSRSVAFSARMANGSVHVRPLSLAQLAGAPTAPGQGIVIVLAGGIHNDGNSNGLLDAGESIAYHYTLVNRGTLGLSALAASDLAGAVTCPQSTLAVGASMACTRTYAITPADQAAGLVFNEVEVAGVDASARPVQGSDVVLTLNLAGSAGIRVFKSPLLQNDADGSGFASVGDLLRYTFTVKNSNAQTLSSVLLVEPDPTRIDTAIVCEGLTVGGQPFAGNGTGTLLANDVALCTADYTVRASDATLGQVLNLVEANGNAPIAGPVVGTGASAVVLPGAGQLAVTKVADVTSVAPGGSIVYTISVANNGTLPIANVVISDPLPTGVTAFTWTCSGALCPAPSGTGAINQAIASFPAGGQVVYTVTATVGTTPPNPVVNIVQVTPSTSVSCSPLGTPPPCQASSPVGVLQPVLPVPTLQQWALLLLAAAVLLVGWRRGQRRA